MKLSFISSKNRPSQQGAELDLKHMTFNSFDFNDPITIKKHSETITALCFGPKNDRVLQLIERHLKPNDAITILYLEDIFKSWSFTCKNGNMSFILYDKNKGNVELKPAVLYFRSAIYNESCPYWKELSAFIHLLNLWKNTLLCRPMQHMRNCSKLLQVNATIIPAIKKSKAPIKIPNSYVIKGAQHFKKISEKHLIAKSLSNIKSDVLDEQAFKTWDKQLLNHLPVLFQEVIPGDDIRVHKLHNTFSSKRIIKKSDDNYRYDVKSDRMQTYETPPILKQFCHAVSKIENNPLLGIDFLEISPNEWACLEANPGPGWSAFHWNDLDDGQSFLSEFLKVLHNENNN